MPFRLLLLIAFSALLLPSRSLAQGEANWWLFGYSAGVDFNSGSPVAAASSMSQSEGQACISDATGNLLFYTDGITVWNAGNGVMPNGTGLWGDPSSTQSAVIVQKPGSTNLYYIFTAVAQVGLYGFNGFAGIAYTVVDMTLDGGNGDVVSGTVNTPLLDSCAEKITAVRHCNGEDIWIIMHKWNSDGFYSYLLTDTGVNATPVISNVGSVNSDIGSFGSNAASIGYLKVSPQGDKLAAAIWGVDNNDVELFDFDKSTGVVSNFIPLPTPGWAYGCSFSPDGSKLYVGFIPSFGSSSNNVTQWDLNAANIAGSATTVSLDGDYVGGLQLGRDNKLYIGIYGQFSLDVISNPNAAGAACNYQEQLVSLGSGSCGLGLPNFLDSYVVNPGGGTLEITTEGCTPPFTLSVSSTLQYYLWSTGDTTTTITVNAPGTYWVQALSVYCDTIMLQDTVEVLSTTAPEILFDDSLNCGDNIVLDAGPNWNSYTWSNGETTQQITVTQSGTYMITITGYANNCPFYDTTEITIVNTPELYIGPDMLGCGDTTLLIEAPAGWDEYEWSSGSTSQTIYVSEPGIYTVTTTLNQACKDSDDIQIEIVKPSIDLGPDFILCNGETVTLTAYGFSYYQWQDGSASDYYPVTTEGTYSVVATDSNGCRASDAVEVGIKNCNLLENGIPNAFSPNGDGFNDIWRIVGSAPVDDLVMKVFNRWGELLYTITDVNDGWDGTYKNQKCPIGVYAWMVSYVNVEDNSHHLASGNLSLLR